MLTIVRGLPGSGKGSRWSTYGPVHKLLAMFEAA